MYSIEETNKIRHVRYSVYKAEFTVSHGRIELLQLKVDNFSNRLDTRLICQFSTYQFCLISHVRWSTPFRLFTPTSHQKHLKLRCRLS